MYTAEDRVAMEYQFWASNYWLCMGVCVFVCLFVCMCVVAAPVDGRHVWTRGNSSDQHVWLCNPFSVWWVKPGGDCKLSARDVYSTLEVS